MSIVWVKTLLSFVQNGIYPTNLLFSITQHPLCNPVLLPKTLMTKQENVTIIEPYTGDWIDRAFDWYYDKESDYASDNIRDYDRQMFREAIEKQEEDYLEEVKALQSLAQKNLEDSEIFLNSIKQDLRSSIYLVKTAKLVMI